VYFPFNPLLPLYVSLLFCSYFLFEANYFYLSNIPFLIFYYFHLSFSELIDTLIHRLSKFQRENESHEN